MKNETFSVKPPVKNQPSLGKGRSINAAEKWPMHLPLVTVPFCSSMLTHTHGGVMREWKLHSEWYVIALCVSLFSWSLLRKNNRSENKKNAVTLFIMLSLLEFTNIYFFLQLKVLSNEAKIYSIESSFQRKWYLNHIFG